MSNALDYRVLARSSRLAGLVSLAGLLILFGSVGYSYVHLRTLRQQIDELISHKHALEQDIEEREQEIKSLDSWKAQLVRAIEALAAAAKSSPSLAARQEVEKAENARYALGFYGFGISPAQYEQARNFLEGEGYAIARGALLDQRPSWLASRSSVFYYDDATHEKARSIAEGLSRSSGTEFRTSKGEGRGVVRGQERWSFFVHYIGR